MTRLYPDIPIDVVNKILFYKSQLDDDIWELQFTPNHESICKLNKYSKKIQKIRECIIQKIWYPLPVYYSYYGDGFQPYVLFFHVRVFSYILSFIELRLDS